MLVVKCPDCKGNGEIRGMGFVVTSCRRCGGTGSTVKDVEMLEKEATRLKSKAKAAGIELSDAPKKKRKKKVVNEDMKNGQIETTESDLPEKD